MNRTERLYQITLILQNREFVPVHFFLSELEISHATFKRDMAYLRDRLNAPIIWDRDAGGYHLSKTVTGNTYELPGLWFSASEIHALLTMQQLLTSLGPGILTPHVEPLLARLRALLGRNDVPVDSFEKRIRIQRLNARNYESEHFLPVVTAVLRRKRLVLEHYNRSRDETVRREVSPQRLNYYQENWYLDAWCHLRAEIRRFSLDSIRAVSVTTDTANEIAEEELLDTLDGGYGIFSGRRLEWAELIFSNERARWVSQEVWHPNQEGHFAGDGTYHLRIPYSDPRELLMDILRHTPEVQVVTPPALRQMVADSLRKALAQY